MKEKRITFAAEAFLSRFVLELRLWGVSEKKWRLDYDNLAVITKDPNVVDVATETFSNAAFKITKETTNAQQ